MTKSAKVGSSTPKTKPAKAAIAKPVSASKKAAPKKGTKAENKEVVAPVVAPTLSRKSSKTAGNSNILELCLLLDCTGSMGSWIERSKNTLKEIILNVKKENQALTVRVCFIGYRDIGERNRFDIFKFS